LIRSGRNERAIDILKPILDQLHLSEACPKAIYLAVPVTSGTRLWDLAAEHGLSDIDRVKEAFPKEFERRVLRANYRAAQRLASLARKRFPREVVVNPSLVDVRGWSQAQYRRAWKAFISRFAKMVLAARGWEFSYGCVVEVTHSLQHDVPVIDVSGHILSVAEVRGAMAAARAASIRKRLRVPFLKRFLTKLERKMNACNSKGTVSRFVEATGSRRRVRKLSS
jgi:hypothetical protein